MINLEELPKKGIQPLTGYAPKVQIPATLLYGMNQNKSFALEDYTGNRGFSLLEELKRRQENLRFVLKEFKRDVCKVVMFDSTLNKRLAKEPYTSLMDVEILNPMGLKATILEYTTLLTEAMEICKLTVAKTIPNAKVFLAQLIADNELQNNRPIDVQQYIVLNTEHIDSVKKQLSKMLDSSYDNAISTFGQQFKRVKDWEETTKLSADLSKSLNDLMKHNVARDVKLISDLVDKLTLKVKNDDTQVSPVNVELLKTTVRTLAEEISFIGAIVHLTDTLVNVMEDNKEYLRDYLTK